MSGASNAPESTEEHEVPNKALSIFKDIMYSKEYKHFSLKLFMFGMFWLFVAGSFGLELRTQAGFSFTGNLLPLQELGYSTVAYFQMMTYHAVVMFFGTIFTTGFAIAYYAIPNG
ncbi:MAG: hypothetical protein JRN51_10760, partial [Nitrososphaerota archaeon]|nr:hypothetical protein [Nitrososphaerota archaeon]